MRQPLLVFGLLYLLSFSLGLDWSHDENEKNLRSHLHISDFLPPSIHILQLHPMALRLPMGIKICPLPSPARLWPTSFSFLLSEMRVETKQKIVWLIISTAQSKDAFRQKRRIHNNQPPGEIDMRQERREVY